MHAYFPALNSYPSLLGDMLADGINCLGFTWVSYIRYIKIQNRKDKLFLIVRLQVQLVLNWKASLWIGWAR